MGNRQSSDALALATDQHTSHPVRRFARFRKRGVRAVPARMVSVMSRGASLAMVALTATGAVQNDLVRSGKPVFVDVEVNYVGRRACRSGNHSGLGSNLLQLGSRLASHWEERQAINFVDF